MNNGTLNAPWVAEEVAPGLWKVRGHNGTMIANGLTKDQAQLIAGAPFLLDFLTLAQTDDNSPAMRNISFAKKRLKTLTTAANALIAKILGDG